MIPGQMPPPPMVMVPYHFIQKGSAAEAQALNVCGNGPLGNGVGNRLGNGPCGFGNMFGKRPGWVWEQAWEWPMWAWEHVWETPWMGLGTGLGKRLGSIWEA